VLVVGKTYIIYIDCVHHFARTIVRSMDKVPGKQTRSRDGHAVRVCNACVQGQGLGVDNCWQLTSLAGHLKGDVCTEA
jgi:hypothetical protein